MKSGIILLYSAALVAQSLPALACINESGTNHRGELIRPASYTGERLRLQLVTPVSRADLIPWTQHVTAEAKKNPSFTKLNDLAAVLIRHGKLPKAVELLQFLEQKYPGHYETASNLGTAFELMGRNEDALTWIQEGLKRNSEDHFGTEWLHVHILKAKLGRVDQAKPGQSILNLDFGSAALPQRPPSLPKGNEGKPLTIYALGLALRYQLIERIAFVPAPDAMVAGLLLDWANLELIAGAVESADVLYDAALRYGSREKPLIALRKAHVAAILKQAEKAPRRADAQCELCLPPPSEAEGIPKPSR